MKIGAVVIACTISMLLVGQSLHAAEEDGSKVLLGIEGDQATYSHDALFAEFRAGANDKDVRGYYGLGLAFGSQNVILNEGSNRKSQKATDYQIYFMSGREISRAKTTELSLPAYVRFGLGIGNQEYTSPTNERGSFGYAEMFFGIEGATYFNSSRINSKAGGVIFAEIVWRDNFISSRMDTIIGNREVESQQIEPRIGIAFAL